MKTYQRSKDNNDLMSMPIEIGGRNLIQNTGTFSPLPPSIETTGIRFDSNGNFLEVGSTTGKKVIKFKTTLPITSDLYIGFVGRSWSSATSTARFMIPNGEWSPEKRIGDAGIPTYHEVRLSVPENLKGKSSEIWMEVGYPFYILPKTLIVTHGKLKSDWTPAPEDIESRLKALEEKVGL